MRQAKRLTGNVVTPIVIAQQHQAALHADEQRRQAHDRAQNLSQVCLRTDRLGHLQQRGADPRLFTLRNGQLRAFDRHRRLIGNAADQRRFAAAEQLIG